MTETDHTLISPFVDAAWVFTRRHEVVLVDVRWYLDGRSGREEYLRSHIPTAVWIDLDTSLAGPATTMEGRHPIPAASDFANALGAAGIGADDTVIAYDDNGGAYAARLVWLLRLIGQNAALLDGGLQNWPATLASGLDVRLPVERDAIAWPDAFRSADEVHSTLSAGTGVVLDARTSDRYSGSTVLPSDIRSGHIPGARNGSWTDNLTGTRTLAPATQLRDRFAQLGVSTGTEVIVYCGSGVTACHTILTLESIGHPASLYPGSWSAWSADARLPVALGTEPGTPPPLSKGFDV